MNKKEYRSILMEELKKLSKPQHEQFSYEIANKLFSNPLWLEATTIGITVSRFPEVDTFQIIRKAWEQNKRVSVPKCHPKDRTMSFHAINQFTQLETVYYGLLEPIEANTLKVASDEIDLLIVPGLAFSKSGYRLGFGGGYYDRFLVNYRGNTVSLAFPQQIREDVPIEDHDIPVKQIISMAV
ncbi:5-formyltetrahydrofolate cyclo-ligase [Pseudoneobacillus sp. C159]